MDEDNIFDDDDTLDYILYEECSRENERETKHGGYQGMMLLFILPHLLLSIYLSI